MAKKSKFMSWLGFGKSDKKQAEADKQQAFAKEQAEKAEQERLAAEQAEAERLQAEAEAERIEQARIAAEQDRLAQEQAEKAEQERLAAEQAAVERLQVEAEAERLEQEKQAQAQRAAAEEKQAIEQANAELLAKQQADAEQQRQEQAKRLAEQEAQMQLEQERIAAEKAENERLEQQRIAAEQAENERLEQQRIAAEQAENERLEQQRIAAEQAENERLEQQRIAAEQAENERLEQQRIAAEQAENERLEQQRIAAEQAENERLEQERLAAEEESERLEQERLTAELAKEEAIKAEKPKKEGFFSRLKKGLLKTRVNIGSGFASIFSGKKIDDELFEELETQLLTADLGVDTTMKLIDSLTDAADRKQLKDGDALYELMKQEMATMLKTAEQPLEIPADKKPFVILMVGVNGVGKTTTIGKMAKQFQNQGKSVMLAAGDTFRAAAVEQLQVWGERNSIPVIAQHTGADSASVVFDAFQAAKARNVDVLIADTAGRLQNKDNLMQELEKIARVMKKVDPDAPHEVMLTIDAGTGQNAISQVNLFNQCVGLTGITLSKLDGTAKGGVIFAVADKFNIPIRYIGVGESIDDLRTFKSDDFIDALFSQDEDDV
ncbi:signal recognition particle-docking protein FtsY [Pseudoalteromonas sp. APC 3356]|uniref:signal recognition particle-docking protein FtsY n=1 Tax=Pseudoalteromonas sp. APC 3356 TaxID=3035185 RepID=UPI000C0D33A8|nr:signal recognition particle-docking protein FtsY [Pseudoalteromonas sp. APC 3356]MDN3434513.1 signal recognition particle-docking protein FtsY [Pseudoalteromonas sp. APC 3356]PHQ89436.1 MAG: signal recognition particle-docking protein FtsY [Pseudoalteromonas sp.]